MIELFDFPPPQEIRRVLRPGMIVFREVPWRTETGLIRVNRQPELPGRPHLETDLVAARLNGKTLAGVKDESRQCKRLHGGDSENLRREVFVNRSRNPSIK